MWLLVRWTSCTFPKMSCTTLRSCVGRILPLSPTLHVRTLNADLQSPLKHGPVISLSGYVQRPGLCALPSVWSCTPLLRSTCHQVRIRSLPCSNACSRHVRGSTPAFLLHRYMWCGGLRLHGRMWCEMYKMSSRVLPLRLPGQRGCNHCQHRNGRDFVRLMRTGPWPRLGP